MTNPGLERGFSNSLDMLHRKNTTTANEGNKLDWETIERLDWHLWILATLLIFVLGVSLLSFMFPTTFWMQQEPARDRSQQAFFGFCVLLALVLVYLLQRQAMVRQLKRQLYDARTAAAVSLSGPCSGAGVASYAGGDTRSETSSR